MPYTHLMRLKKLLTWSQLDSLNKVSGKIRWQKITFLVLIETTKSNFENFRKAYVAEFKAMSDTT
jgi:hypothetical protein